MANLIERLGCEKAIGELTDDQKMIRDAVREFAHKRILPNRMIWGESQFFPRDLFVDMGKIGLMGMLVPEKYGGSGLGYVEYKTAIEEVASVCVNFKYLKCISKGSPL